MELSVKAKPLAKKCMISVFLALTLVFTSVCPMFSDFEQIADSVFMEKANASERFYGDIDFNGKISASDARFVLRAAAGLEELTEEQKIVADIVKSDPDMAVISSSDARYILRTSVGLEEFNNVTVSGSDYGDTGFEIGNIVVNGEDVSFDIIATSGSIENFDIELHYDPSVIELVNEEFISYPNNMPVYGLIVKGKFMYAANCHNAGKISFSGVFTENLAEDSGSSYDVNGTKIFTVNMKIKDKVGILGSAVKLTQQKLSEDSDEMIIDEAILKEKIYSEIKLKTIKETDEYLLLGIVFENGNYCTGLYDWKIEYNADKYSISDTDIYLVDNFMLTMHAWNVGSPGKILLSVGANERPVSDGEEMLHIKFIKKNVFVAQANDVALYDRNNGDSFISGTVHEHVIVLLEEKSATCTEDGYQIFGCSCRESEIETIVLNSKGGHNNTVITTSKPTHISEGINFIYCNVCDYYTTEEIPKLEEHTFVSVATAPTCTTRGYSTYICLCGESYIADYTELIDHHDADEDYLCDTCEEPLIQDTEEISCDHMCHKDGFLGFIWKLINFFSKLFGVNPVCECGVAHY